MGFDVGSMVEPLTLVCSFTNSIDGTSIFKVWNKQLSTQKYFRVKSYIYQTSKHLIPLFHCN